MLKLTNSFYRYLTVTTERVNYRTHLKKYSHLSHVRAVFTASQIDFKSRRLFNCCAVLQKHSNSKKHRKIKIPPLNIDELDRTEKMEDMENAKLATYGGTFVVSSDEESSPEEVTKKHTSKPKHRKTKKKIPPNIRQWEELCRNETSGNDRSLSFKVVSYNVLAQNLLESHPQLYLDCSPHDLDWKVRFARLYDEIVTLSPDILCLQEVQVNHLKKFYSKLEKIGYRGVFKQKTGQQTDGCAIYYRTSLFALDEQLSVEFNQPNLPILNRDNIGLMVKLTLKRDPHKSLVVATTHLLYNPARHDVRLAQIQLFLAEIDRFSFYRHGSQCGHLPIILTGDFNAEPDSTVSKLLACGSVNAGNARDDSDWEPIGITDNCQHLSVYLDRRACQSTEFNNLQIYNSEYCKTRPDPPGPTQTVSRGPFRLLFNGGELWHSLQFHSVYNCSPPVREATTYQDRWVIVDYIYYSASDIQLTHRLQLPTIEQCKILKPLPNEVFASDHLALAAVFKIG